VASGDVSPPGPQGLNREHSVHNLSISLNPLDRDRYGRQSQIRDLAQRVIYALAADAQRIDLPLPFATRREGGPSDNGGVIIDAPLPAGVDLRRLDAALKGIAGVVDHGLFLDLSPTVVVGGVAGVRVISGG